MFMFPASRPRNYRLRNVSQNTVSSELFTPDAPPRCTQDNVGVYSFPLPNTVAEYEVDRVKDKVLDLWVQAARAWWIDKPGKNAQQVFEMSRRDRTTKEIDPRFQPRGSIFPRGYQYEADCAETRRQYKLLNKIARDEAARKQAKDTCICEDDAEDKHEDKLGETAPGWARAPELFAESQQDPCKRRAEFEKFGQTYRTEACRFYYDNYPPPPPSKFVQKFSK